MNEINRNPQQQRGRVLMCLALFLSIMSTSVFAQIVVNNGDDLEAIIRGASGGDIILVNSGTYGSIYLDDMRFTEANPLIVKANNGATVVVESDNAINDNTGTRDAADFTRCSYIVFDGIAFRNGYRAVWINESDHLIFKNCEFTNTGQEGVHVQYRCEYIDFIDCLFAYTGEDKPQWGEGLYVGRGSGHDSSNWPDNSRYIWVEGCEFHHTGGGEAINIKGEVFHCTIRGNYIHNITLGVETHGQKNEGAISLDHTSELNGQVYQPTTWRENWVENNTITGVRPGRDERVAAIYSAGTGNYIVNNIISDVDDDGRGFDARGIRLNGWSGDNLQCYVWNNTVTNTKDPNNLAGLGIESNPGNNPNGPQTWYDGGSAVIEIGQVTWTRNDEGWDTITLSQNFDSPVVIMSPVDSRGGDPCHIRVKDIQSNEFKYQVEEWEYRDGPHGADETLFYLVMEAGVHNLGGKVWEAGKFSGVTNSWTTRNFSHTGFDGSQVVITQIGSNNDPIAVVPRVRNVTSSSFQVRVQEEEAQDPAHGSENIHYIAIEPGAGTVDGADFRCGVTPRSVNQNQYTINFGGTVNLPAFFARMSTQYGFDTSDLRYRSLNSTSVQVRVEEETSKDSETNHTTEQVSWLAIGL